MGNPFHAIRSFIRSLGLVEQSQVVASTVVVVSMVTIIAAILASGQTPRGTDFISILTVGVIGSAGVYFSLRYSRELDDQRRQLLAVNTIAEAVNREAELDTVLQTALTAAAEQLNCRFGWIYMIEGSQPALKCSIGTTLDFAGSAGVSPGWITAPETRRERRNDGAITPPLRDLGIRSWASVPLRMKESAMGALVVAAPEADRFAPKQQELLMAFANQIILAIHKAQLFDLLKQSERRYADLFENSPDIYFTVGGDHAVLACNSNGAALLGYPKESIIGRPFEQFFSAERREPLRQQVERVFREGFALRNAEERMIAAAGAVLDVHLNSSLLLDGAGNTVGARVVARDISERKRMEAALLHAQKIDSIGNLAGGIAHDFNNILASVLGSATILRKRTSPTGKLSKYLEIIETAARRGSSLTRQLLTFARKAETRAEQVSVNMLVNDTLQLFQRSVSKGIVVQTGLTEEPTEVNGDEGQIQQALLNLFLNARDAMPGGGTLTVTTECLTVEPDTAAQFSAPRTGSFVRIGVADTGTGIDPAIQQRIFEPFFTTKDQGTGLGLSVLYGVVQNHGGFITLDTGPGKGTSFQVYLPRITTRTPSASRRRSARPPRGTEHILVVDDEVSVCEITRDMLTDLGYTVTVTHDGRSALDTYRTRRGSIDLVLLDINMPEMGGEETFARLREMNPELPIVILTGYGRAVVETSRFPSAIDGFMQKPFQLEELAARVRAALDARRAAARDAAVST